MHTVLLFVGVVLAEMILMVFAFFKGYLLGVKDMEDERDFTKKMPSHKN